MMLKSQNEYWNKELQNLPKYSRKNLPVLLIGESGVGKEVIAKHIHEHSSYHQGLFVAVNCSALKESLIESELFGHVKGSFTGAIADRKGAFEMARDGTLFLDEIGDLDICLQPKLLRALENQEIRPVGSDRIVKTNVRVIAATHRNLNTLVTTRAFRSDLFFRLSVIQIGIPPLRDRMEDFEVFLSEFSNQMQIHFAKPVIEKIKKYNWPGNIREMKNFVARAATLCQRRVRLEDLPFLLQPSFLLPPQLCEAQNTQSSHFKTNSLTGQEVPFILKGDRPLIKELERKAVIEAIVKFQGNQRLAAKFLGMCRSTFYDRMRKYNIHVPVMKKAKNMSSIENTRSHLKNISK